ncbi:hypothetical protein EB061_06625 [bacterium]|nr:hypothetical protein [bacterium]
MLRGYRLRYARARGQFDHLVDTAVLHAPPEQPGEHGGQVDPRLPSASRLLGVLECRDLLEEGLQDASAGSGCETADPVLEILARVPDIEFHALVIVDVRYHRDADHGHPERNPLPTRPGR